jgi:hypothetical protein
MVRHCGLYVRLIHVTFLGRQVAERRRFGSAGTTGADAGAVRITGCGVVANGSGWMVGEP